MRVIAFAGPAGSGKDTAGTVLEEFGYHRTAFAYTLKAMLAAANMAEPADRTKKEEKIEGFDFTWRDAAQTLGTEWGRNLDPDLWLKLTLQRIEVPVKWVITDCRFENEAAAIRKIGLVIHLKGRRSELNLANQGHASEKPLIIHPEDKVIDNSADSIDNLKFCIERLINV